MTNYKNGFLSVVAAMALASSVGASSYVPLTSENNDNQWIMFGVNGLKLDGATAASTALFTDFYTVHSGADTDTQKEDLANDEFGTAGLLDDLVGNGGTALAEIKALNLPTGALTSIKVNFDSIVETFSSTEPVRTMYFKAQDASYADAMFTYKASLEGKTLEFQINGDDTKTYQITISADNTFDNPATRIEKVAASGTGGTPLNTIPLAMDFDFLDNPRNPAEYVRVANADNPIGHQTANASASTRVYGYDANAKSWIIYDSNNNALANDFTELKEGKAYWAKVDLDDDDASDAHTEAGLVLGSSGLGDGNYTDEVAVGWNLMSFDGAIPDIRNSNTGMILTDALGAGSIDILDSTGINTVTVNLPGGSTEADAIAINLAIEAAKSRGEFPDTFDLRAFKANEATEDLLLISNKKFTVLDTGNTEISAGWSMAGQGLWDTANNVLLAAGANVPALGVTSVYGESGLIFKALIGANTAAELDEDVTDGSGTARSAAVQIGTNTPIPLTALNEADTTVANYLVTTATQIEGDEDIDKAVAIDLDNDGTVDYIMAAATEPFYIRDHTFTRVMAYDATNEDAAKTFKIGSPTSATVIAGGATGGLTDTVTAINAVADTGGTTDTKVYAAKDGANIVFVTSEVNANNFKIFDHESAEFLIDSASSNAIAKGAVQDVFSINYLAKQEIVTNKVTIDLVQATHVDVINETADTIAVAVNGNAGADIGSITTVTTAAERLDMFDKLVDAFIVVLKANNLDGVVSHNYDVTLDNTDDALITLEGYGLVAATTTIDFVDNDATAGDGDAGDAAYSLAGAEVNTAPGTLSAPLANLSADLKYNAVYTPDYAKDGPLYTLKDIGYTPSAIITANTNMAAGTIAWDSLDLTRPSKEWFRYSDGTIHNDYDLFSIDGKAGYWVYLDENTDTNDLAISNITIKPTFVHHFNNTLTTVNHVAATVQFTVTGLPTDTAPVSVYANIGGSNVEMASSSNNGVYTGSITSYEVQNLAAGGIRDITVSIADGTGYRLAKQTIGSIDFEKPVVPTASLGDGTAVALASTSTDTTGYYIFKDAIPEEGTTTSNSLVAKILSADATSYNLCSTAASFGIEYTYRAIAVDGLSADTGASSDGELGYGNASDAVEFKFSAMLKEASLLTNTEGVDVGASDLAMAYDATCTAGATDTNNAGVSVKSVVSDTTVKLSYAKEDNVSWDTDTPLTIYVGTSSTGLAEIKYVPAYAGNIFYIELNGILYSGTFPADDYANRNTSVAYDVSGNPIIGQSF